MLPSSSSATGTFPPAILDHLPIDLSEPAKTFVARKTWLVDVRKLRPSRALWGAIPGFRLKTLTAMWASLPKLQPLPLQIRYEAIQVSGEGHRLRAFDIDGRRSLKIVQEQSRYGEGTLREVLARRTLLPKTTIRAPRLYDDHRQGNYIFVEEEMVRGRLFNMRRDHGRFAAEVIAPLRDFYAACGIERRPLCDMIDAGRAQAIAEGRDGPEGSRIAALLARNPMVAVSMGHGDLSASNLAVDGNGVIFLDWEMVKPLVVGCDFLHILRKYPQYPAIREAVRLLFQDAHGDAFTLEDAVALSQVPH